MDESLSTISTVSDKTDGPRKAGGRKKSSLWTEFTDNPEPNLQDKNDCKWCGSTVSYNKKSELVKKHLDKCRVYKRHLLQLSNSVLPAAFQTQQPAQLRDTTMMQHLCPALSPADLRKLEEKLSMFFYTSGTPFLRVENSWLQEAFEVLRADVVVPDRKAVAGRLLNGAYEDVSAAVQNELHLRSTKSRVTSDAWTNTNGNPIVTYNLSTNGGKDLFIESVSTKEQGHSAEWMANDAQRVMTTIDPTLQSIAGMVTDNTNANKAMWKLLSAKYPDKFFYGCVCHALHLIVKAVFAGPPVKGAADYPFTELATFTNLTKNVVLFFKGKHKPKAILEKAQDVASVPHLSKPGDTRWGSIKKTFDTVLKSEKLINTVCGERAWVELAPSKQRPSYAATLAYIQRPDLIDLLQKGSDICAPIDQLLVLFQSSKLPLSHVYDAFDQLADKFVGMKGLSIPEIEYIQSKVRHYWKFIYSDAHGIAYLLDPKFVGQGMPIQRRERAEELIAMFPVKGVRTVKGGTQYKTTESELQAFITVTKTAARNKTAGFERLLDGRILPTQWWINYGEMYPSLQDIAQLIFSLTASSAFTGKRGQGNFAKNC